jgi:TolB-like protein/Flp pilus assembly protein TadD
MRPTKKLSETAIRAELAAILGSPQFAASPKQSQLLSYLVAETLAGRGDKLKGYSIGVDVFGRGEDFDPSDNSLVRVTMSRLRALLEEYYAAGGDAGGARIVLQPGDYAPRFVHAATPPASSTARAGLRSLFTPERAIIAALVALIIAMLTWNHANPPEDSTDLAARYPDGPSIAVAPFEVNGSRRAIAVQLSDGLQHEIVSSLSQLPNLGVLGRDTVRSKEDARFADGRAADFVLIGTVTVDYTDFVVSAQLVKTRNQVVVWSHSSERTPLDHASFLTTKSTIAVGIAAELGEPYGVIHQAMRNGPRAGDLALTDYFCELRAYDYMQSKDPKERAEARGCLEAAIAKTPRYSDALALLAWIRGDEGRLAAGRKRGGDQQKSAKLAVTLAERAVRSDPTNATAYLQLALAQFFNGNDTTAKVSIDRALRLAPSNTEILANAAWLHASWGDQALAGSLANKAITLNPSHPAWYWLGPALSALAGSDKAEALRMAELYRQEDSLHSGYVLAAALAANGRADDARQVIAETKKQFGLSEEELQANIGAWRLPEPTRELAIAST